MRTPDRRPGVRASAPDRASFEPDRLSREDVDLVIVGAGPAGSAAALSALQAKPDARVVLLDRAPLGRDKVCGDGIAPHAVAALERLGASGVREEESVPLVRLSSPGGVAEAVAASPGFVVPRRQFDERLARAAISAGARFEVSRVASLIDSPEGVLVGDRYRARVVIGADGANSVVRRWTGQPSNRGASLAVAIRGYAPTPPGLGDEIRLRWDDIRSGGLCYAWAFPTASGLTNIGYGMSSVAAQAGEGSGESKGDRESTHPAASGAVRGGRARLMGRLRALLPEFDLDGVTFAGHTLPLTVSRPVPARGRALLVGDAASLVNPFTGEGIYSAIVSGELAGAAAVGHPDDAARVYRRELHARFGAQHRQLRALYPLINSRRILETVIGASESEPALFDRLLDVGLGDSRFALGDVFRFGRFAVRPTSRA